MFVVVPENHAYVVERLGRYHHTLNPGLHILTPLVDRVAFRYSLAPKDERLTETAITRDNIPMRITSSFRWQIADAQKAAYGAADLTAFITGVLRHAQREWIGGRDWEELRETTRELQQGVLRAVAEPASGAGLKVESVKVERVERVT